jgi:hypothetical protein
VLGLRSLSRMILLFSVDSPRLSRPQNDPPISLARSGHAVIAFESATAELMLRSRVIQALEVAVGPDWQAVARPVG